MQETTVVEGFRLSPQQRRLWKLQQDTPNGHSAFVSQVVLLVEGELCVDALRAAIERICERQEALRTVFRRVPSVVMPVQVVADEASLSWQVTDSGESKLLSITIPALCADRRTLNNFASELWRELIESGAEAEPLQYIQFSEWQNSLAEEEDAEKAREYWTRQDLRNASASLAGLFTGQRVRQRVPLEIPRELQSTTLSLSPELATRIAALATKHDTRSATVLLAAWQTLLWRLTQQSVAIGNVTEGRSYELLHDGLLREAPQQCLPRREQDRGAPRVVFCR